MDFGERGDKRFFQKKGLTRPTISTILILMDGKIHCEDGNVVSAYWPEGNKVHDNEFGSAFFLGGLQGCCPVGVKGERGPIGLVRGRLYRWNDFGGHIVRFVGMYDDELVEVRHHKKTYYVSSYDLSRADDEEVKDYLQEAGY